MRAISDLITDVRFTTNEKDENRFPDDRLLAFFNDAQDQIEALIMISNFENSPLDKISQINIEPGRKKYSLPSDMYAWSSISKLEKDDGDRIYKGSGYYIVGSSLYLNYEPSESFIALLTYKAKLPRIESINDQPNLPAMCEPFLKAFVERKIIAINSSSDISNSSVYTNEEKSIMIDIFSSNSTDLDEIPMIRDDYGYFEY